MTTLLQQIEAMRLHMNELADSEQGLVRALGNALNRADDQLLSEVRQIAAEHEVRRGLILKELQGLAGRMGSFPRPQEPAAAIASAYNGAASAVAAPEPELVANRGDWRQAASNIEDELHYHLNGRAPRH